MKIDAPLPGLTGVAVKYKYVTHIWEERQRQNTDIERLQDILCGHTGMCLHVVEANP